MQAISTKFLGPTNTRGSRYKATCEAGIFVTEADHTLGSEENHVRVARKLIDKLGWFRDAAGGPDTRDWFGGSTPDGYVFVCGANYARLEPPHA